MAEARGRTPTARDMILKSAALLFGERGFDGVSLRMIADECGIPLSTLSHHFPKKQSLQEAVLERALDVVIERALASLRKSGTPQERLLDYIPNLVTLLVSDIPEVKVFDRELQSLSSVIIDKIVERPTAGSQMTQLIGEMHPEVLRAMPAKRVGDLLFSLIYGATRLRRIHGAESGHDLVAGDRLSHDIEQLFLRALGQRPDERDGQHEYYAALGQFTHEHLAVQELLQALVMERGGLSRGAARALFTELQPDAAQEVVQGILAVGDDRSPVQAERALAHWWLVDGVRREMRLFEGGRDDAAAFRREALTENCRQPSISAASLRRLSHDLRTIKSLLLRAFAPWGADGAADLPDGEWHYQPRRAARGRSAGVAN